MTIYSSVKSKVSEFFSSVPDINTLEEQMELTLRTIHKLKKEVRSLEQEVLILGNHITTLQLQADKAYLNNNMVDYHKLLQKIGNLTRKGNMVWGGMESGKASIEQYTELYVNTRKTVNHYKTTQNTHQNPYRPNNFTVEGKFQEWELQEELQQLRRKVSK